MDVYRKVLIELYKVTDGDTSETVNLLDLVKKLGFFPSYKEIVKELAYRSWIYEDKDNKVKLTHWGANEAKKWQTRQPNAEQNLQKNANRLSSETKEFSEDVEKFTEDITPEKLTELKKRVGKINQLIEEIETSF